MKPIKFALVKTNFLTRWPCHVCGGNTEKEEILCEAQSGEHKGLRVCETCLKDRNFDAKLEETAQRYEERARETRELIGRLQVPSYPEWQEATTRAVAEYLSDRSHGSRCPKCHGVDGYLEAGEFIEFEEGELDEDVPFGPPTTRKAIITTWLYCETHMIAWPVRNETVYCSESASSWEISTDRLKNFTQVQRWLPAPDPLPEEWDDDVTF